MPFIEKLLSYKSVSFVGLEKNTGKTQTLNYVLDRLCCFKDKTIGVTSIGIDGETTDSVTNTHKPEIILYPNNIFTTCSAFYNQRELVSNILCVSERSTNFGKLITAKVMIEGKVKLSGANSTKWLGQEIEKMHRLGSDIVLVDGALSRLSLASPLVSEAMILSTGAAISSNLKTLVQKTKNVFMLTQLPSVESWLEQMLIDFDSGIFAIDKKTREYLRLPYDSVLMLTNDNTALFSYSKTLYVCGIVTDNFLSLLLTRKDIKEIEIIVRDFTRIFAQSQSVNAFISKGGEIKVLKKCNLIAMSVNPTSPSGYNMDSALLVDSLKKEIDLPIYDIKQI